MLGEKLAHSHCKKKEFSRILVRIASFLNLSFTANMRGFLFILSVVLTVCCFTANMFRKWQEDVVIKEGLLGVAHAFTSKRQEALIATERRWIKSHCSKLEGDGGEKNKKWYTTIAYYHLLKETLNYCQTKNLIKSICPKKNLQSCQKHLQNALEVTKKKISRTN